MKAAQISQYASPAEFTIVNNAAKPEIGADQVLIEVHAASVNPFDVKVAEGYARGMAELHFPAVLGADLSGKVAEVGTEVSHVKVGDAVYGMAGALSSHGSYAEFAPVSGGQIAPKPANISDIEAAALPLVGVSAIQALIETLDLQKGQKILIHGGSGGIGSVGIQIAKHLGAYVATTSSANHTEFVKSLGADEVIDYKTAKFQDVLSDYDAVFDTVGGDTFTESFKVLKPGGSIVTMAAQASPELDEQYGVTSFGQYTQTTVERLTKLTELVESGAVTINVDKTFPLAEIGAAFAHLETAHPKGKVVIIVKA